MSSDSENEDPSQQSQTAIDHVRRAEDMLTQSKLRKEAKRKAIEAEYMQRVSQAHGKIKKLYQDHAARVAKAQNAQWDRIEQLLKKRQAIESKIHNEIKTLEEVKNNIAGQMICICNDRLQEMYEIRTMGKTPKDLK